MESEEVQLHGELSRHFLSFSLSSFLKKILEEKSIKKREFYLLVLFFEPLEIYASIVYKKVLSKREYFVDAVCILESLLMSRLESLIQKSSRTLVSILHYEREKGNLGGDTSEDRFKSFLNLLAQKEYKVRIFNKFPVLKDISDRTIKNWSHFIVTFLEHFYVDHSSLFDVFHTLQEGDKLFSVSPPLSDPHIWMCGKKTQVCLNTTHFEVSLFKKENLQQSIYKNRLCYCSPLSEKESDKKTYDHIEYNRESGGIFFDQFELLPPVSINKSIFGVPIPISDLIPINTIYQSQSDYLEVDYEDIFNKKILIHIKKEKLNIKISACVFDKDRKIRLMFRTKNKNTWKNVNVLGHYTEENITQYGSKFHKNFHSRENKFSLSFFLNTSL